jgi:hypothetical protein
MPWGEGIEAIVFHTIVDQRGCGELLPSRRSWASGGRPGPAAGAPAVATE